ncbi:MAG: tRNA lysidine(34) synthetase TilS [Candidatus Cloacimonadota bacterium]|nr:tRNA lysidine(34) synthetase TilS [Candidatus Cloacimonadota bacterium]
MSSAKNILKEFQKFIKQENLIQWNDKIIVAVSGGIDSTILLDLIKKISAEYNLTTLAVHINYHLRGDESNENEQFVRNLCYKWGFPLVTRHVEIKEKSNLENKARKIRFSILRDLLQKYQFQKIALGHNKNDQAETLLLNLFRGSGIGGMKGIIPKSKNIIRPLLALTRNEITEFAKQNNIEFSADSSNLSLIYDRNKIRHKIIPEIEKGLNPKVVDKISNSARIFQQTDSFLQEYCKEIFPEIVKKTDGDSFILNLDKLKNKDIILFYISRKIFGHITGSEQDFFTTHFQAIADLLRSSESKYIQLPKGVFAIKDKQLLTFSKSPPLVKFNDYRRQIKRTSRRILFKDHYVSISEMKSIPIHGYKFSQRNTCYVDLDKVKFPVTIRYRQPGDRFTPLGMHNPKKLKNFFIDSKVPRFERDKIILVEDQNQIIWLAGIRISENIKITRQTKHVLRIKSMKKLKDYRKAKRINK